MTLLIFLTLLILFFINVPIAFAIAITTFIFLFTSDTNPTIFIQRMVAGLNSFPLLAIPLFLLAGAIMNQTTMSRKLFDLAQALVGFIKGGLAQVNVLSSMLLAGVSGSSTADAALTTKLLVPQMVRNGYPKSFAVAVTAASATIGPIIPPSVLFVIYGWLASASVGKLFLAGAIPGILIGIYLMITVYIISKKNNYGMADEYRFSVTRIFTSFKQAIWALLMPIIVLGGIIAGVFTATEAAAIAVLYCFILGIVMRELKWKHFPTILKETIMQNSMILIVVAVASPFGWTLTIQQIPQMAVDFFTSITSNYFIILLIINVFFLIIGMFMETVATMIIIVPILMPLIAQLGVDPVHFGIILVFNLLIGQLTPPLGMLMFTTTSIAKVSVLDFQRAIWPFYIALVVSLLIFTYFPWLFMWLPELIM
jgi:tripartite ATP-independent transporter DctM subunit